MDLEQLANQNLDTPEGLLIERKEGRLKKQELRKYIVAFANSVPMGKAACLYFGISDSGEKLGIDEKTADEIGLEAQEIGKGQCYPPIEVHFFKITNRTSSSEKVILCIVVPSSQKRPHFSGKAYKRIGSRTEDATDEMLSDMIAGRNDVIRKLQEREDKYVVLSLRTKSEFHLEYFNAYWEFIDATTVQINTGTALGFAFSPEELKIIEHGASNPWIEAAPKWTEREHIVKIAEMWACSHHEPLKAIPNDSTFYLAEQLLKNSEQCYPLILGDVDRHRSPGMYLLCASMGFELLKRKNLLNEEQRYKRLRAQKPSIEIDFATKTICGPLRDGARQEFEETLLMLVVSLATTVEEAENFLYELIFSGSLKLDYYLLRNELYRRLGVPYLAGDYVR